ncbi:MAG TPA: hypothetical protein VLM39_11885, partial [Ignavibacteriaceae bacterium]|nr:hypothetical protein [Ignavibacteriaceae bacterium]
MKLIKLITAAVILNSCLSAQDAINTSDKDELPIYYRQNSFWLTSPGAMKYGLYGFDNPALLSALDKINLEAFWSSQVKTDQNADDYSKWGLFTAVPHLGFGFV